MCPCLTGAQNSLPLPLSHRRVSNTHVSLGLLVSIRQTPPSYAFIDSDHRYSLWGIPVSPFTRHAMRVRTFTPRVPHFFITLNTDHRILAFSIPRLCPDRMALHTHIPLTKVRHYMHSASFHFSSTVSYQNANPSESTSFNASF